MHKAHLRAATAAVRAIKTVWKRNLRTESLVRREISILKRLDHPGICRIYETFEDAHAIYLVLEFIDGKELFDEILQADHLSETKAAEIMYQIFNCLQYCHERHVVHRDLKPENIMTCHGDHGDEAPDVKLIDFGLAEIFSPLRPSSGGLLGTVDYMAPEARTGSDGPAADVWSAGMVLHALLLGCLPAGLHVDFASGNSLSRQATDLLSGLLQVDPAQRLSASLASVHPWFNSASSGRSADASGRFTAEMPSSLQALASFHGSGKLRRAALTALAMQLTGSQLQGLRAQFMLIDTDCNGRISKEELAMSVAMTLPGGAAQDVWAFVDSVFNSVDTDGSNEIDYTEWVAAALQEGAYRCDEALHAAFRVFDRDGSGGIDQRELSRLLAQSPEEIAKIMPQFDANGDGVIDFEEFKSIFEEVVPKMEGNLLKSCCTLSL